MAVADLGVQAVLVDPSGAHLGAWQPGTFQGFGVLNEPGTPNWFELLTKDYPAAVAFYRSVFHWDTDVLSDTDEFRYAVMRDPGGEGELAGIMDAARFLPEVEPSQWAVYWDVEDLEATLARVVELGGAVVTEARDLPYGQLGEAADPAGARFKLRAASRD